MVNISTILLLSKKIYSSLIVIMVVLLSLNQINGADHIEKDQKNRINIDQNVQINKNHLPFLLQARSRSTNETMIIILTRFIETLQKQESINAKEMEQILTDIPFNPLIWISSFKPIVGSSSGTFFCFPGFWILYFFGEDWSTRDKISFPYVGPCVILLGNGDITIYRMLGSIEADHYLSLGFLGFIHLLSYERGTIIDFMGISSLTITFSYPS